MNTSTNVRAYAVVRKLIPLLQFYPWAIPAIIVLGILSSFAEGLGIGLIIPFIQNIERTGGYSSTGNYLIDSLGRLFEHIPPEHRPFSISLTILGFVFAKVCLSFSYGVLSNWLNTRIGHQLLSRTFAQLLSVSYGFFQSSKSGDLWNTLTTETWKTCQALSVLINLIITACTLAVYLALILIISWKLTLLVTATMLLISMIIRLMTNQVSSLGKKATRANADLAERMLEGFRGMKVIRSFVRETYECNRFNQASERVRKTFLKLGIIQGAVDPVYEILAAMLLISILLSTLQNHHNLPTMLAFVFILYRIQPKIKALESTRISLLSLSTAVEEVTSLLDCKNKPYTISGNLPFQHLKTAICFDGVTFCYDSSDVPVLQNVSICIPAGKTTALVGPSGAGKSTLINLILRFYDVRLGQINVDDHILQQLDLRSWRNRIAMVSQDVHIFHTTVRENIAYGRLDATDDEIIAAAIQADAHHFIVQLPRGYDTILGDQGIWLSGGQQQRITLARAIVRDPDILILDEATNALDSISEDMIKKALDTLGRNRTVIIIAHRLSTIEQAEHIIVLDEGRVHEQGDFNHLMELDGLFARLYRLQYQTGLISQQDV